MWRVSFRLREVEIPALREGDKVEVETTESEQSAAARKLRREDLLQELRTYRGLLPADYRFDRDEANHRP